MGEFHYIGTATLEMRALEAIARGINLAAEDLVGKAQEQTPVDTGTLKASIHVDRAASPGTAGKGQMSARVATGGEANDYAIYVHEGTYKMTGRPFLANALIENRATYVEFMRREFRAAF